MDLSASLLASKLLSEVTPYIGKGIEDLTRKGLGIVYDKIKSKLAGTEDDSIAAAFEADPGAHQQKMEQAVSSVLEVNSPLRQETESALRSAGVNLTGSVNINGPIDAKNVSIAGTINSQNMN